MRRLIATLLILVGTVPAPQEAFGAKESDTSAAPTVTDVSSGGGLVESARHRGYVVIGTPIAEHERRSDRYTLRIGIGAVVASFWSWNRCNGELSDRCENPSRVFADGFELPHTEP